MKAAYFIYSDIINTFYVKHSSIGTSLELMEIPVSLILNLAALYLIEEA